MSCRQFSTYCVPEIFLELEQLQTHRQPQQNHQQKNYQRREPTSIPAA